MLQGPIVFLLIQSSVKIKKIKSSWWMIVTTNRPVHGEHSIFIEGIWGLQEIMISILIIKRVHFLSLILFLKTEITTQEYGTHSRDMLVHFSHKINVTLLRSLVDQSITKMALIPVLNHLIKKKMYTKTKH